MTFRRFACVTNYYWYHTQKALEAGTSVYISPGVNLVITGLQFSIASVCQSADSTKHKLTQVLPFQRPLPENESSSPWCFGCLDCKPHERLVKAAGLILIATCFRCWRALTFISTPSQWRHPFIACHFYRALNMSGVSIRQLGDKRPRFFIPRLLLIDLNAFRCGSKNPHPANIG